MSNYYDHHRTATNHDDSVNDSLWDELSHQQTREIEQHHNELHNKNIGINMHMQIQPEKIKQAVTETATKFASAAKGAAKTAQEYYHSRNVASPYSQYQHENYHGGVGGGSNHHHHSDANRYMGPYAKIPRNQRGPMMMMGGTDGACADFGLRDSVMGEYDGNTNTASSAPLLSNNYGMDAELGVGGTTVVGGMDHHHPNPSERKFVFLESFGPKRERGTVANLDLFFTSLYNYYYHRGIVPIVGKGIVELTSLFFTLWLSVFLFAYVDWHELKSCKDEESCKDFLSHYIKEKPFEASAFRNFMLVIYILLFSAYGTFAIATFVTSVKDALTAKFIFEDKIGISSRKLEGGAVEWHEIVAKILELQRSGEYKIAIHEQDVKDELVIAQRIMRRENFMIAFFNQDILDLSIPLPWKGGRKSRRKFYSKSIEWSIYFCVLSFMFNHKYQIRPAFCIDAMALQRRFMFCGIAHMVLMPFLLVFMTLHFFMQNMYDFRNGDKQPLGPKDWSYVAKWTFREFNELPHVFERRLAPAYGAADRYLKLFAPSAFMNSIGRLIVFLSGSLGAVCVALAAMNDAILLHVKVGNWNLLWYAGMLGVAYSTGKGMVPDDSVIPPYHHDLFSEMDAALVNVSNHTHYYPEFWKKRGWDSKIKGIFSQMFMDKVNLFLSEVLSIILAPVILCKSLPSCAMDICAFVQNTKTEVSGTGDHCGFATFDFDMFSDENWEGQQTESHRVHNSPSSLSALDANRSALYSRLQSTQRPKTKMGKMEKSFFNFKTIHPAWKCSSSGQDLVDKMENYRAEQEIALAHERQHHIAAAARQLETLALLEQKSQEKKDDIAAEHINEHYVRVEPTKQSEAPNDDHEANQIKRVRSDLKVHFKDPSSPSSNNMVSRNLSKSNLSILASVLRYDDLGLSAELNGLLDRSTLDAGASMWVPGSINQSLPSLSFLEKTQSSHVGDDETRREQLLQRQYKLLERYHSQTRLDAENESEVMNVAISPDQKQEEHEIT